MRADLLLARIRPGQVEAPSAASCHWPADPQPQNGAEADTLYHNHNAALNIDFHVQRLPLAGLQVMDPRLVSIAPGACNECHRHAHESIFVVLAGHGELRLGAESLQLKPGDIACVPRWVVHQSRNTSADQELRLLAITDFGLTSAVLGDYDSRTRLKAGGADALEAR